MRIIKAAVAAAALAVTLLAAPGAAHAAAGAQVWYHPGDQYLPATIWHFDADGTGYLRSYSPSLTGWALQRQTGFTFERSDTGFTLHTVYGGTRRITGVSYAAGTDVWAVSNDGWNETWYGCRSAGRPLYAAVAC
ncbi:hypothetical protein [Actinoplanes sp. L3-i22]|uniref:hypothetical protein n=1 Tax=Actinoplanes sp. L3-i22 TaxID=2836373 RepID=UPI001C77488E|nr:hypothetical protein [Actinoplanes sp. L3-i22]BCY08432.1 hypothetical protein L3i22_035200 [Actinoplanes sp. L3-i22]